MTTKNELGELAILATKLPKKEADLFRELAARKGTTVSRMLSEYIRAMNEKGRASYEYQHDYPFTVQLKPRTFDRLKHAVSFNNPLNLNPDDYADRIINKVLDIYDEKQKPKK